MRTHKILTSSLAIAVLSAGALAPAAQAAPATQTTATQTESATTAAGNTTGDTSTNQTSDAATDPVKKAEFNLSSVSALSAIAKVLLGGLSKQEAPATAAQTAPSQPAAVDASGAAAERSANTTSNQKAVETHTFTGSGTSAKAFQKWFAGEEYVEPTTETRDLATLPLPDGTEAQPGDVIGKTAEGTFFVAQANDATAPQAGGSQTVAPQADSPEGNAAEISADGAAPQVHPQGQ